MPTTLIDIDTFVNSFSKRFPAFSKRQPWEITNEIVFILQQLIGRLKEDPDYRVENDIAVHNTAIIEQNVVLKGPVVIGKNCFVAANAYLREGAYLDSNVKIGAGCEIKSSLIFENSSTAHFNYVGNSIIGSDVNVEAGAVTANHYNERKDKKISVFYQSEVIRTNAIKFGALIGDNSKIGANAVLSPGTILPPGSVVKRLELIEQIKG